MPKGLPVLVKDNLEKCRSAAIAAVDVYNRPGPRFRTAHYIVLIVIAWTGLFHAIFYRKRVKPRYRKKGKSTNSKRDRYDRVDGEPKHWDLAECLRQHYGSDNPPERRNLEFLLGLRNKIEHRQLPDLDAGLYGECQAALMNLEALISSQFGSRYALTEQLAVALQFSGLVPAEKTQGRGEACRCGGQDDQGLRRDVPCRLALVNVQQHEVLLQCLFGSESSKSKAVCRCGCRIHKGR